MIQETPSCHQLTFTTPTMCWALRCPFPGSIPGQLQKADLSMRELQTGAGNASHENRSPLLGPQAPFQGALGTQPRLEASQAMHTYPIVSGTSGRNSIHSEMHKAAVTSLSRCCAQGILLGALQGNQGLFLRHSL